MGKMVWKFKQSLVTVCSFRWTTVIQLILVNYARVFGRSAKTLYVKEWNHESGFVEDGADLTSWFHWLQERALWVWKYPQSGVHLTMLGHRSCLRDNTRLTDFVLIRHFIFRFILLIDFYPHLLYFFIVNIFLLFLFSLSFKASFSNHQLENFFLYAFLSLIIFQFLFFSYVFIFTCFVSLFIPAFIRSSFFLLSTIFFQNSYANSFSFSLSHPHTFLFFISLYQLSWFLYFRIVSCQFLFHSSFPFLIVILSFSFWNIFNEFLLFYLMH